MIFLGPVQNNGVIEENHYHAPQDGKEKETAKEPSFIPVELRFFDQKMFGAEDKQQALISLLKDQISGIDITSGRGWFAIYAGWRYYTNQLAVRGGYVDFFSDIEHLLPDVLTDIAGEAGGDRRYRKYTTLLGREADAWYMDGDKLPPLNEITLWKNRFDGDANRYEKSCKVIVDVYRKLRQIS